MQAFTFLSLLFSALKLRGYKVVILAHNQIELAHNQLGLISRNSTYRKLYMNNILQSLLQQHKYIFPTSEEGCTLPISVNKYLENTQHIENLTSVLCWDNTEIDDVWSIYNGWNMEAYLAICRSFFNLLDTSIEDNEQFIELAKEDDLSPLQAVSEWFHDEDVKYELVNNQFSFIDINVFGLANISRVTISSFPQKNEMFDVYLNGGQQVNCFWDTDLATSLKRLNE